MSLADELAKGGGKFLAWEYPGTFYDGVIKAVDMRQARKYKSSDLDFWDDGTPKMQAVLTLATDLRDPADPEDDGTRQISINLWSGQKAALVKACKAVGVPEPQPGQAFRAVHVKGVGTAESPREFEYTLGPAPAAGGGLAGALAGQAPQQASPTPPAPPAAPQQQGFDATRLQVPPQQPPATPAFQVPAAAAPNAADIARQLLAQGHAVPDVAAATGLPGSTVAAIAAGMQQQPAAVGTPPF